MLVEVTDRWRGDHGFEKTHKMALNIARIDWVEMRPSYDADTVAVVAFGIMSRNGNYERTLEYKTVQEAEAMYQMILEATS